MYGSQRYKVYKIAILGQVTIRLRKHSHFSRFCVTCNLHLSKHQKGLIVCFSLKLTTISTSFRNLMSNPLPNRSIRQRLAYAAPKFTGRGEFDPAGLQRGKPADHPRRPEADEASAPRRIAQRPDCPEPGPNPKE